LRPALLADIARGLAAVPPLWRATARHDPDIRRPVRLLTSDRFEVWVIGWTTDQHARLHDHGTSTGALMVTAGKLTEILPCADRLTERELPAGQVRRFPTGIVHDVINRAPQPATSIHVYSPPLATMTYYDPTTLEPTETTPVAHEDPVLGPRAASLLLHLSIRAAVEQSVGAERGRRSGGPVHVATDD
jgi:predicted metal-dependent enzyme (double-stranded beta helix superfamily)